MVLAVTLVLFQRSYVKGRKIEEKGIEEKIEYLGKGLDPGSSDMLGSYLLFLNFPHPFSHLGFMPAKWLAQVCEDP